MALCVAAEWIRWRDSVSHALNRTAKSSAHCARQESAQAEIRFGVVF